MKYTRLSVSTIATIFSLLLAGPVHAHVDGSPHSGFIDGLLHPLSGADHLLAALAVGLWAGLARRSTARAPLLFTLALAAGLATGTGNGIPAPLLETAIVASLLSAGLLLFTAADPARPSMLALAASFGLIHGYAHGAALPEGTTLLPFAAGVMLSTGALTLVAQLAATTLRRSSTHTGRQ